MADRHRLAEAERHARLQLHGQLRAGGMITSSPRLDLSGADRTTLKRRPGLLRRLIARLKRYLC